VSHYLLSAEASFSAAHRLPGVEQCDRLHGHNWRIRLTVRVTEAGLDPSGMGVDFREIEKTVRTVVSDFDHAFLNDLGPFRERPPTAERVASVVCERAVELLAKVAPATTVCSVDAWETPEYRVTYYPE
jgi:6-pyruvoyltetrahydropterin/6-carboxytetrahydropterin synthase